MVNRGLLLLVVLIVAPIAYGQAAKTAPHNGHSYESAEHWQKGKQLNILKIWERDHLQHCTDRFNNCEAQCESLDAHLIQGCKAFCDEPEPCITLTEDAVKKERKAIIEQFTTAPDEWDSPLDPEKVAQCILARQKSAVATEQGNAAAGDAAADHPHGFHVSTESALAKYSANNYGCF